MATEQYEPLNVQIDEESAGCCSSTKYCVLRYPMNGKSNPSWTIVQFNGEYRVEFTAKGNGKTYCHRSGPFSRAIQQLMENKKTSFTKDDFEVRIAKNSSVDLGRYFL
ncbi:uncharacterized protein LOC124270304 isoform X2 [Haliotis rubra]|nr:uncharacterized protein LOC124270304 isoform X2 [Haliotis rubra]